LKKVGKTERLSVQYLDDELEQWSIVSLLLAGLAVYEIEGCGIWAAVVLALKPQSRELLLIAVRSRLT
jgi:hypothetical protein